MTDTPTAREAANRLAALKALKDAVDTAYDAAKSVALEVMDRGDRKVAMDTSVGPDGVPIGTVTKTDPKPKATVHDEAAFLVWVETTRPDHIVTIVQADPKDDDLLNWATEHKPHWVKTEVHASWRKHLLDLATELGTVVDPKTGEVIADGISVEPRQPWITVTQSADQAVAVLDALDRADIWVTDLMVDTNDAYNALAIDAGAD